MYQKRIFPYFIIPSTFSPQASSPLNHHRQTEGQHSSPPVTYRITRGLVDRKRQKFSIVLGS